MQDKLINIETKETHLCNKVTIEGYDYFVDISRLAEPHEKFINESICPKEYLFKPLIATTNPNIDCAKVVDEVEVMAYQLYPKDEFWVGDLATGRMFDQNSKERIHFIAGYNKAKETDFNSDIDMIKFADFCRSYDNDCQFKQTNIVDIKCSIELLELFKQQKPKTIYFKN